MTKLPFSAGVVCVLALIAVVAFPGSVAVGSGGTIAVSYDSATVCGIVAERQTQYILCYQGGRVVAVNPNVSFSSISGGRGFFCGVRSGGYSLLCWDTLSPNSTIGFEPKRVYYNGTVLLENLAVGDDHICSTVVGDGAVKCWRSNQSFETPSGSDHFASISSGSGFSCGISTNTSLVRCWGSNQIAKQIETEFGNEPMSSIAAGGAHVCGLNISGSLICKGSNDSGQLNPPSNSSTSFSDLALGENHTCGILRSNGSVVCWGGAGEYSGNATSGISFESIVSGLNFTCGLTTGNFSILCWGPGWTGPELALPLPKTLPGPCVDSGSDCGDCGIFPQSETLCFSSGYICNACNNRIFVPPASPSPSSPQPSAPPPSRALRKGLLAFAIIGSVGAFSAICTIIWCLWTGVCFGDKKIHNSVQPTITRANSNQNGTASNHSPISRSSTIRRQTSRAMRRQRSGTSSKHADRAEEFTLSELATATDNFSPENKIGAGSFGVVYRGKLPDGREVAIKRGETSTKKKFQEKESAFDSELAFLSRLHHKNLVRLVGYCEEDEERLLVYEYMINGALYDHLHDKNNTEKSCNVINFWKIRIQIGLDAARGIEYLHSYAVPPIIHRDIKSSNILLDENWTARVSDFGLSLMGGQEGNLEYRPMKAVGTVGYIDPEYYGLNVLTAKSDVYGLGVVLLELLTGRRAIFKDSDNGGTPISVVDYAVPAIMAGELGRVLDKRVGPPEMNEGEAVELVAYTAMHCVNLEGKERPTMGDIVANLERALAICDASHGSVSSGSIAVISD